MKENKRSSRISNRNNEYVYDNLARKTVREEKRNNKRLKKVNLENEKRARLNAEAHARLNYGIDFVAAAVLIVALACIIVFVLNYLTLSSKITELDKQVSTLSSSLSELESENDEAYASIDSTIDLKKVYAVAVTELGMVYPDENQIVNYDYVQEGYVRQYKNVPEN